MELWIRSQDKERIIKVNNIFIHQDNNHLICANQRAIDQFNDESFELGAYSSRKRALEVLDEIQNILNLKDMYKYDRELVLKSWENIDADKVKEVREQMSVYEMPKE